MKVRCIICSFFTTSFILIVSKRQADPIFQFCFWLDVTHVSTGENNADVGETDPLFAGGRPFVGVVEDAVIVGLIIVRMRNVVRGGRQSETAAQFPVVPFQSQLWLAGCYVGLVGREPVLVLNQIILVWVWKQSEEGNNVKSYCIITAP